MAGVIPKVISDLNDTIICDDSFINKLTYTKNMIEIPIQLKKFKKYIILDTREEYLHYHEQPDDNKRYIRDAYYAEYINRTKSSLIFKVKWMNIHCSNRWTLPNSYAKNIKQTPDGTHYFIHIPIRIPIQSGGIYIYDAVNERLERRLPSIQLDEGSYTGDFNGIGSRKNKKRHALEEELNISELELAMNRLRIPSEDQEFDNPMKKYRRNPDSLKDILSHYGGKSRKLRKTKKSRKTRKSKTC